MPFLRQPRRRGLVTGGDRGPAFGPGRFGEGQRLQFGGQRAEAADADEPGCLGLVLGQGEQPG